MHAHIDRSLEFVTLTVVKASTCCVLVTLLEGLVESTSHSIQRLDPVWRLKEHLLVVLAVLYGDVIWCLDSLRVLKQWLELIKLASILTSVERLHDLRLILVYVNIAGCVVCVAAVETCVLNQLISRPPAICRIQSWSDASHPRSKAASFSMTSFISRVCCTFNRWQYASILALLWNTVILMVALSLRLASVVDEPKLRLRHTLLITSISLLLRNFSNVVLFNRWYVMTHLELTLDRWIKSLTCFQLLKLRNRVHIRDSLIDRPCGCLFSTGLGIVSSIALSLVEIVLIDRLFVSIAASLRTGLLSFVLVIQSLTTIFGLFSQRVDAFHVCLKQVVLVLDTVLD